MLKEKTQHHNSNKPAYWDRLWASKRGFLGCENKPYYEYLFNKYFRQAKKLRILDVGCGGNLNHKFFFNDSKSCLVHFDLSKVALSMSREKLEYGQKTQGVANYFIQGTALSLPFKSDIFDIVMSSQLLHHFNKQARSQVVDELERVCKNGGFVILAAKNKHSLQSAQKMFLKNPPPFYPLTAQELSAQRKGMLIKESFNNIKVPFLGCDARCNKWLNQTFRSSSWARWIAMDHIIIKQKIAS